MHLDDAHVRYALDKAREIAEQYRLYVIPGDGTKKSVDDLLWLMQQYLEKRITPRELLILADDSKTVHGMYAAMADGSYEIYVLAELGGVEGRFVLCKELFHVVIDKDECRNMHLYEHVVESQSSFSISTLKPNVSVQWEALAEIAAMEFLFPYADRVRILEACGGNPDFAAIAHRYGVPQVYIEMYLSLMDEFAKVENPG
jgi:Zn-dependent peptidase ImmA (M78 family)